MNSEIGVCQPIIRQERLPFSGANLVNDPAGGYKCARSVISEAMEQAHSSLSQLSGPMDGSSMIN